MCIRDRVEGITLKKYIEKRGKLPYKEAVSIAIQVANGMEAAHKHHIVPVSYTHLVIGIGSTPKIPAEKIKDIDSVSQSGIQAVGRMIQLAAWLKKQYGSTMNQALKTVLPVKEKVRQKEKKTVRLAVSKEKAAEYLALYEKKNAVARVRLLKALCKTDENGLDLSLIHI